MLKERCFPMICVLKKQRVDNEEDQIHRTRNVSISSVGDALRTWYSFQAPPSDVPVFRMKLMGMEESSIRKIYIW